MTLTVFAKLAPARPTKVYDTYWRFAEQRQATFFNRIEHPHGCWTEDPILAKYKFTNAYRASDRVSQFLLRHVIYQGDSDIREVFFRTILFKLFNRIETWKLLEQERGPVTWRDYKFDWYDKTLSKAMERGEKIYSAAYIMPMAAGFEGQRKHQTHLRLLQHMMQEHLPERLSEARTFQAAFEMLRSYPMMGGFLAFQFAVDLNYSQLLNFSELDFVVPGPGARDGIRKCFETTGGLSEADIIRVVADRQQIEFDRLGIKFRDLWGRPLQLIDCQNLFCEVDKYARIAHPDVQGLSGRSRIKQMYKPIMEPICYWYPPKWGINDAVEATLRASGPDRNAKDGKLAPVGVTIKADAPRRISSHGVRHTPEKEQLTMKLGGQPRDSVPFDAYQDFVMRTDNSGYSGREGMSFALLGLYGETGSLLSEIKKKRRESNAYSGYAEAVVEEFGDVLWYFCNVANRAQLQLGTVAQVMMRETIEAGALESDAIHTFADIQPHANVFTGPNATDAYEKTLMRLGAVAGEFLAAFEKELHFEDASKVSPLLAKFLRTLVDAANDADISLAEAVTKNMQKAIDRWPLDRANRAPLFDEDFHPDEQLPRSIEITFTEKTVGKKRYVIQKLRGLVIGDRLTDNMVEDDGYRFHDVFHLSYAAILGWSPVIRALLRCKRKSEPEVDEVQDGQRAIIVEEGISTWIFSHAKRNNFFRGLDMVDFSLLKSIRRLVVGLEVERCPLWQWERAILEGFRVFNQVRQHGGGIVTADLTNKQLSFRIAS